nr:uncharacterized protein LOC103352099 [Oryctolagus cuniculus]
MGAPPASPRGRLSDRSTRIRSSGLRAERFTVASVGRCEPDSVHRKAQDGSGSSSECRAAKLRLERKTRGKQQRCWGRQRGVGRAWFCLRHMERRIQGPEQPRTTPHCWPGRGRALAFVGPPPLLPTEPRHRPCCPRSHGTTEGRGPGCGRDPGSPLAGPVGLWAAPWFLLCLGNRKIGFVMIQQTKQVNPPSPKPSPELRPSKLGAKVMASSPPAQSWASSQREMTQGRPGQHCVHLPCTEGGAQAPALLRGEGGAVGCVRSLEGWTAWLAPQGARAASPKADSSAYSRLQRHLVPAQPRRRRERLM